MAAMLRAAVPLGVMSRGSGAGGLARCGGRFVASASVFATADVVASAASSSRGAARCVSIGMRLGGGHVLLRHAPPLGHATRRLGGALPLAVVARSALAGGGGAGAFAAGAEIASRVASAGRGEGRRLFARYRTLMKERPYAVGFVVCAAKGLLADTLAQKVADRRGELDRRRTLAMALFSGSFCGCAYHFVFNVLFERCLGPVGGVASLVWRAALDTAVVFPVLYMPSLLFLDETLRFGTPANLWKRYEAEIGQSMRQYVKIWPAAMMFAFGFMPAELRVTFIAAVSFGWLVVISTVSHR